MTRAQWGDVYLKLKEVGWTGPLLPVSYYECDSNGVDITGFGRSVPDGASATITPTAPRVSYTTETSIDQIAHDLAWFLYDEFASSDTAVDLVGFSMGGLVIRDAIYRVQAGDPDYPPYLYVPRALTISTPHAGYPASANCGSNMQCSQMAVGSAFMTDLALHAMNPQSAEGTTWTVVGGNGCDVVPATSALAMPQAQQVEYTAPCYAHSDYLWDYTDTNDSAMTVTTPGTDSVITDLAAPHSLLWLTEVLRDSFVPVSRPAPTNTSTSTPTETPPSSDTPLASTPPVRTPPADTVAPSVEMVGSATDFQASTRIRVAYSATDPGSGVATYDLRYRVAAWDGSFSAYRAPPAWQGVVTTSMRINGAPGNTYCYSARASDVAGNISAWTVDRCVVVPVDDAKLLATSTWTRTDAAGAYEKTLTSTKTAGARLKLRGLHADQFALVVMTCPRCGQVVIYLDGVKWRTVGTHAASVHHRVVIVQPSIDRAVHIIGLASGDGKRVAIDGLGIARS